jgi:hypothetical protein
MLRVQARDCAPLSHSAGGRACRSSHKSAQAPAQAPGQVLDQHRPKSWTKYRTKYWTKYWPAQAAKSDARRATNGPRRSLCAGGKMQLAPEELAAGFAPISYAIRAATLPSSRRSSTPESHASGRRIGDGVGPPLLQRRALAKVRWPLNGANFVDGRSDAICSAGLAQPSPTNWGKTMNARRRLALSGLMFVAAAMACTMSVAADPIHVGIAQWGRHPQLDTVTASFKEIGRAHV